MVLKRWQKLRHNKSAGLDVIHPHIMKETDIGICSPLALIFNHSIQEGQIPKGWKEAHITALHKKEINEILKIIDLLASHQYVEKSWNP